MMENSDENIRRSTRLKSRINYSNNGNGFSTPQPSTQGRSSRGRRRTNSMSNIDETQKESLFMGGITKELENIEEEILKPSELFHEKDVSGNRIYGFQTPSRKRSMAQKALLSRTPGKNKISTPTKKTIRVLLENIDPVPTTPSSNLRKSMRIKELSRVRKRQVHFLNETESESESVSEDSEFVPSNSEESDEIENEDKSDDENKINENNTPKKNINKNLQMRKIQIPITPCRRSKLKNTVAYRDYHLKTDEYFETQAEKSLTSDHTLGQLKNPRIDETKLQELLKNKSYISNEHKKGMCTLMENYKSMFLMWHHIMEQGYSVLLYGLGSKRSLISDFQREIIPNHYSLVVNGFFPSLTIKDILDNIVTELFEEESPANPNECFNIIEDILNKNPDARLYLLIHNIDGIMLRSNKSQDMLSRLAAISNVRLLASVDHINSPLLWDNTKRSRYNFYWCDVTTFMSYEAETSYENSLLVQHSGALALSSLYNVFASLTTNAKAIYTILVNYQLENSKNNLYSGMAFKDLYRGARESFLVSTDVALRTQLTEFLDHKLVKTKRNIDGAEYLIIPLDNSLLKKFIEDQTN